MTLEDRVLQGFGPEDWEHKAVVDYCDARSIPVFHIPNSTYTTSRMVRERNRILGVRPGVPDLCVVTPSGLLWIEMKQLGKSTTTPAQQEWIERFENTPGSTGRVCKGANAAITFIEQYIPLPDNSHSPALPRRVIPKKQPKNNTFDNDSLF